MGSDSKDSRGTVPVTAGDYRRLSARRLPRFLFDYIDGGAGEERSMRDNEAEFGRIRLLQRVMRDVGDVDTGTRLAGRASRLPLALAPVGLAGMMARRGEVQAARAAEAAGVAFTLSTVGICPVEEVQAAVSQPVWFQLYMLRDRELVRALLDRARDAGCETLVFTVDLAVVGPRYRDVRNGLLAKSRKAALSRAGQLLVRPHWLLDVGLRGKPHVFGSLAGMTGGSDDFDALKAYVDTQFDPSVTWKDIAWLREQWPGRLLIKGVMNAADAVAAADVGGDGVVVSNHGGRQLEGVAPALAKLPEVVAAVGDRVEVLMDGGVRSGTDIVKAVALGARGVLIGRPWVWALSACGEAGVCAYLELLRQEMAIAMALMGVTRVEQLTPELLEYA